MGRDRSAEPDRGDGAPPVVSAIVPCHNASGTLRECLAALRDQTRAPDEIIVVDDASADDSALIAAEFGCTVVRLARNRGPSGARNEGIAAARGDVLFFVDSDVALRPDAVERAAALLAEDPELDIVHGTYVPVPLRGRGIVEHYLVLREAYWRHRFAGPANVVVFAVAAVRRSVFDRFGPLDERLRDCEDVEYSARMAGRAKLLITETVAGSHDAGSTLAKALRTQWKRSVPLPSLKPRGVRLERINRMRSLAAVGAALASLPFVLLAPQALLVTAAALLIALASDAGLYAYARRHLGLAKTAQLAAVHLCFTAVLGCGILCGLPAARSRTPATTAPTHAADHSTDHPTGHPSRSEPYATH
ncbi:glycosyltransferase family 2 protein [Glycomyces sp. NRRL B-16210]|uniref:glycosyltransferase family 2 protein n=1 Tax=Glycomyces sp. NRRL B-16210 TaxID=1463821 RepID=UPI00068A4FAB|nr:glycosyltransferase family 2 protein [Glycomyces sp. NRRL B-16210]